MFEESFKNVSIIMPALNEEQYLESVFDAIANLKYPKERIETILVDNGSEDETVSIAKKRGAMVLEAPDTKIGELRNLGAENAKGSIFAFLDSDCIVDRSWLKCALDILNKDEVGAVGSHTRIPANGTWVERTLDFHATKEGVNEVEYLPTANLIVKREVFERVGGFNLNLETGEDSDFCHKIRKLKIRLISDTNILVVHMGYPKNLWQLYKKEMWHSKELYNLLGSTKFRIEYIFGVVIPFIYTLCLFGVLSLIIKTISTGDGILLFYAAIIFFFIPILLALYKGFDKNNFRYLVHSIFYFTIILIARVNANLSFFWEKIRSFLSHSLGFI